MLSFSFNFRARTWSTTDRLIFRAFTAFVFWAVALYSMAYSDWFIQHAVNPLATSQASLIDSVLRGLGFATEKAGAVIRYQHFSMEMYYKCTGIYQGAGLAAAILAFPVAVRTKMYGLFFCLAALSAINLFRIISIFYAGVYFPQFVGFFHAVFWEGMMIVLALFLWLVWASRVKKRISRPGSRAVATAPNLDR